VQPQHPQDLAIRLGTLIVYGNGLAALTKPLYQAVSIRCYNLPMSEIESQIFWLAAFLLFGFACQGFRSKGDDCALESWFESDCGDGD
jgi:hypothetical protein